MSNYLILTIQWLVFTKRSDIFILPCSWKFQVCLSVYDLQVETRRWRIKLFNSNTFKLRIFFLAFQWKILTKTFRANTSAVYILIRCHLKSITCKKFVSSPSGVLSVCIKNNYAAFYCFCSDFHHISIDL